MEVLDGKNGGSVKSCFSHWCKTKYMLLEEIGTNRINDEEEKDKHSDSKLIHDYSKEDDYNKD